MNSNSLKNVAENVRDFNDISNKTEYRIKKSEERSINDPLSSSNDNDNLGTIQTTSEFDFSSCIESCGGNCDCKEGLIEPTAFESYSPSFSSSSFETCYLNCTNTSTSTDPEVTKYETILPYIEHIAKRNRQTTMPPKLRTHAYFMFCLICKERNTNPYFQYCFQCFYVRMVKVLNKPGPKPKGIKRIQRCCFPKKL